MVYSLDLGSLLAGTKYRGDFEKRFKGLLAELKRKKHAILFIDEIHTIIGAGAASGGVMDASNLLKPLLSSGDIRCIGSTTFQEYRGMFDKDRALSRRFQKIDVGEPSVAETVEILKGLSSRFEEHYGLRYSTKALQVAAELANRYITDRFLPDKAIDVIDEAGAYQRLQPESRRKKVIGVKEVEEIVAKIARIPPRSVSASDKESLRTLDADLKHGGVRAGRGDGRARDLDQALACRPQERGEADRLLPVRRPHRGGQDRGEPPAREDRWASS